MKIEYIRNLHHHLGIIKIRFVMLSHRYIFFELVRFQHRISRLCNYLLSRLKIPVISQFEEIFEESFLFCAMQEKHSLLISFVSTDRIFGSSSIYLTELTFWLSNIGLNWFLYKSKHLSKYSIDKRLTYSSFLSTIFNFGSIMIVNNMSHFFGRIELLRLISSLTLSSCLLSIGYVYLEDIEK
jgi:hypothetical protein